MAQTKFNATCIQSRLTWSVVCTFFKRKLILGWQIYTFPPFLCDFGLQKSYFLCFGVGFQSVTLFFLYICIS